MMWLWSGEKKVCARCGCPNGAVVDWCHDCNALLPIVVRVPDGKQLLTLRILIGLVVALLVAIGASLLTGCAGKPFTSRDALEDSNAGAGGYPTMSQAGAGGETEETCPDANDTDAGETNDAASSRGGASECGTLGGESGAAGAGGAGDPGGILETAGVSGRAPSGGSGGGIGSNDAGAGAASMGAGGSSSGASSGGSGGSDRACLVGWRGSSCDVCSSGESAAPARTCGDVLGCYAATSAHWYGCDYEKPTSDMQVELAHSVALCRCGHL